MDRVSHLLAFQEILCQCPCCGDLFRLSEARLYRWREPRPTPFDRLRVEEDRLERIQLRLEEELRRLRERSRQEASRRLRRRLRSCDPLFTAHGYYPKDARPLLDPVDYVVFDGLSTRTRLRSVVLLDLPARDRVRERLQRSIERVIRQGDVEWLALRVQEDGTVVPWRGNAP
ncbi:MAG: Holliday junction resolvase-like protein [Armatimonadota bacterium]|nr:Holliday junction resolvase-like protein [Armatimonadota bacterium]